MMQSIDVANVAFSEGDLVLINDSGSEYDNCRGILREVVVSDISRNDVAYSVELLRSGKLVHGVKSLMPFSQNEFTFNIDLSRSPPVVIIACPEDAPPPLNGNTFIFSEYSRTCVSSNVKRFKPKKWQKVLTALLNVQLEFHHGSSRSHEWFIWNALLINLQGVLFGKQKYQTYLSLVEKYIHLDYACIHWGMGEAYENLVSRDVDRLYSDKDLCLLKKALECYHLALKKEIERGKCPEKISICHTAVGVVCRKLCYYKKAEYHYREGLKLSPECEILKGNLKFLKRCQQIEREGRKIWGSNSTMEIHTGADVWEPHAPNAEELMQCDSCGKLDAKLLKCGRCLKVRYCSKKCQKNDWKTHKKICKKLKNIST